MRGQRKVEKWNNEKRKGREVKMTRKDKKGKVKQLRSRDAAGLSTEVKMRSSLLSDFRSGKKTTIINNMRLNRA